MRGVRFPSMLRSADLGPHPSGEGRGHFPGFRVWLRAKWVARAKVVVVGWMEDEPTPTVMRLMWTLNSALPSKIIFDIGIGSLDKKIKS